LGFILATLVTGFAADRIGNARLLWIAAVALIVGPLGFGLPGGLVWIASLMFVIGLGLGTIEVAANGLMLDLHPNAPGRYLNLLATCHGVGALAVPLVAAKLVTMGFAWEAVYIGVVVLALPLLLLFSGSVSRRSVSSRGVYCERNIGGSADGSASDASSQSVAIRTPWRSTLRSCFTPLMCGYYFAIACYVAVELGVGAWAMEYSQREEGLTAVQSSYLLSGFFAMIMAGRFLGAWVVDRLSFVTIVCVALALGVACLTAALFGSFGAYWPFEAYWLLALSGLFFSVVFPTITAHVAAMHDQARGAVMGLLFTFGGIGGAVGPAVVGYVAQWTNLRTGLATTIVFGLASLVTMLVISMLARKAMALDVETSITTSHSAQ
jgi:fucose permease